MLQEVRYTFGKFYSCKMGAGQMDMDIEKEFPILETERFVLRSLRLEDEEGFFELFSDPEVLKFYNMSQLTELEQAREHIAKRLARFAEGTAFRWAITLRGEDRLLGTIGFHNWDKEHLRAEVGYDIARRLWGQGAMSEVLPAVVRYGFEELGLNRMAGLCDPQNHGSRRVMEKAGFQVEGLLRENYVIHGKPSDALILSLLKRDWEQHTKS